MKTLTNNTLLSRILAFSVLLAVLLVAYVPLWQTIPNGSDHYYMIDVGETQVVLNVWGTLHATGYPLYVMLGNLLTDLAVLAGLSPVTAPALTSTVWGGLAMGVLFALAVHLTGRVWLSALVLAAFGLTLRVWLHSVVAEIYTFGLMLLALLLYLALRRGLKGRVYWLAFVGGIGVAHHRGIVFAAPALIFAAWDDLTRRWVTLPLKAFFSAILGLIGFFPYLYLPLRARANAAWVYGEPGTFDGFLDQFLGAEGQQFINAPVAASDLLNNAVTITASILQDLTTPAVLVGVLGLVVALFTRKHRLPAMTLLLSGGVPYTFQAALWFNDPLPAFSLPTTLSLAFGWLLLADVLLDAKPRPVKWSARVVVAPALVALCVVMVQRHRPFIIDLITDRTGLETVAIVDNAPPGSTVMLDWGPRYFAVGLTKDVLGGLDHITLVDHQADFAAILEGGGYLVTPSFTFFNRPVEWWEAQIGEEVFLRTAALWLVEIDTQMLRSTPPEGATGVVQEWTQRCTDEMIFLNVDWQAVETPDEDLSVFVHLLDSGGALIAQADSAAPVYGWRPLTTWRPTEIIRDMYPLPRLPNAAAIRYGLYKQNADGSFENVYDYSIPVGCDVE